MFQEQAGFEQIGDDEIVWRYQDLPRYLDLLIRKQLFFTRIDQFEDPFEGKYKQPNKESINQKEGAEKAMQNLGGKQDHSDMAVTVNTWHQNSDENYAMWNIYAKSYGVAIQTTYKKLKDSFAKSDKPVYIGKVIYYNEEKDQTPMENPLDVFIRKRCLYQYENEIRCCYVLPRDKGNDFEWEEQDTYNGVFISVDLNTLIERIYISPYAPKWYRDLVARTNEVFKIEKEIRHSSVFQSESFS
jgi:hypothetical protein